MARELDEAWVEEAIARHRMAERLRDGFEEWVRAAEVSVHSADQLVEVRVCADGSVRKVSVAGPLHGHTDAEVARSVELAVGAAAEAAAWARRTLYAEFLHRGDER
jgi:DNA-binding protein YbaB